MKINGRLEFDASSASEIQNLRIQKYAGGSVPAHTAADVGRLIYVTTAGGGYLANTIYQGGASAWVAVATGGDAALLQDEVNAIETSLGAGINADGTFNEAGFTDVTGILVDPTSFTDAINQLAGAVNANNTLAELDDVSITPTTGDFLRYNGTVWADHVLVLADVTDVTVPAAELNLLNGLTASAAELNILDGVTGTTAADISSIAGYAAEDVSAAEFGYLDGVTSSIQTQLDNKQALDATLTALAGMGAPDGFVVQTATDTFSKRTLQQPGAGITISNPAGIAGDPTFALANDLAGVEGLTGTGYAVRTGADTWTNRVINGVAGRTVVTNGDGVASNTDVDLATVTDTGAGTFLKITRDAYGRVSGTEAVVQGDITTLVDGTYVNVSGDTMTGDLIMGANYVTMNNAPTLDVHGANKAYVDSVAAGLTWKNSVRAASTANIAALGTTTAVDGVTLVTGDRVLVKDQTASEENGIYTFNGTGLVRSSDMDAASEFAGATVFVTEGSTFADTGWTQTAEVATLGTDPVSWSQFSGSNTYTWGTGLANTGNTVYVNLGAGVTELPGDEVGLDVVSNLALQLTSNVAGGQLTFVLAAGSGLEQSTAGLKISDNGVTNAMLLNESMTFNADSGNTVRELGETLIISGTSAQGINTSSPVAGTINITAADASASQKGVASFNAGDFTVTAGNVVIAVGGVDNNQLANSSIGFTGTDASTDGVALGETLTFASSVAGLVSAAVATNTVTMDVRLATTTATGVASFNSDHFSVTAGAVDLAATLDDLTNVSGADAATTDDLLTKSAGDWVPVSRVTLMGSVDLDDIGDVAASHVDGHALISDGTDWVNQKIYHLHTQGSNATTWNVAHSLGVQYCNVTVVDSTDEVVIPQSITFTDANNLVVTFNTAIQGKVVVMGVA